MKPFTSGMTGCWLPAFYHGHTLCVHVKVPTFTKKAGDKEAENRLYSMCVNHHEPHLWKAMCDCHKSEKSGQSKDDVWMNTHGCWMLCKFMIAEGIECMRFHDVASGSQIANPKTGQLVSFESEIQNHSKQKRFHQKHQKPDTDTPFFQWHPTSTSSNGPKH